MRTNLRCTSCNEKSYSASPRTFVGTRCECGGTLEHDDEPDAGVSGAGLAGVTRYGITVVA